MSDAAPRERIDDWAEREVSRDGSLIVEYVIHTQRMSHETRVPRLILAATGETLLAMPDSRYDGAATWREGSRLTLTLCHYDVGGRSLDAEVDWVARTIEICGEVHPLRDGPRAIVRAFERLLETGPAPIPAAPKRRHGRIFVLIALALLLFGGIVFATRWFTQTPKQALTKLPEMPSHRR